MPSLPDVVKAARERKLFRKAAIYYSTGMTFLGLLDLVTKHYGLTTKIFDVLLTLLLCSFPGFILFQWRRSAPSRRKMPAGEIVLDAALVALAVFLGIREIGQPPFLPPNADAKAVAVLPFVNMSDSKDDEYFSDGVTEDILTQLSKIGDLKVISRTSVMPYKKTSKSLRQIGRELGVGAVLEGSVRREKDRVRIAGQLIDARTDEHLWAETFDRQLTDIFAIQSDVARKIAAALKATLSPGESKSLDKRATENLDAYAFYVRGREYYYRYAREDNERAIEFFRKALDLDPGYALAYAGLADAFVRRKIEDEGGIKSGATGPGPAPLDQALAYAEKAVALDPDSAEAYKALGFAQDKRGKSAEALAAYLKAIEKNPNYAPAITNIAAFTMDAGRLDEALGWMIKAIRLQPGSARFYAQTGLIYHYLGLDVMAEVWLRKSLEFQPDYVFAQFILAYVDLFGGRSEAAWTRVEAILKRQPADVNALEEGGDIKLIAGDWKAAADLYGKVMAITGSATTAGPKLALILRKQGQAGEADRILKANLEAFLKNPVQDFVPSAIAYVTAQDHFLQGRVREALEALSKSVDLGYVDRWMAVDPVWEGLRADPRFREIVGRYQARMEAMRKRVHEAGLDQ